MVPADLFLTVAGALVLALGGALLPGSRERRLTAAGLLLLGLALAAWRAGAPPGSALTPPGRLGTGFLVVNGGLLLLGMTLAAVGALRGAAPGSPAGRLLVAAGLLVLGWEVAGVVWLAGWRAVGAALGLATGGAAIALAGRVAGTVRGLRRVGRALAPPPIAANPPSRPAATRLLPVLGLSAAVCAFGPHLGLVFVAVIAAAWAGYFLAHRAGARPVPVAPVLTLLLVPAYWVLAVVAGPLGLRMATLDQVPLSPAAELLVAPALLLAGWAVAGLWPLARQVPGAWMAPFGALLLARVALPLVPAGLAYWRPLAVPLLMLGLWHAALHARWALVLAGAGMLGLVGAGHVTAAGVLLATGLLLEVTWMRLAAAPWASIAEAAAWPVAAYGGLLLLEGALRGEVVYTAVGAAGLALLLGAARAGEPRASDVPHAAQTR